MATAELCGPASCLGLGLNKQVKLRNKKARWSLQPHLHPPVHQGLAAAALPNAISAAASATAAVISNKSGGFVMVKLQKQPLKQACRHLNTQTDSQEAVDPALGFMQPEASPRTRGEMCQSRSGCTGAQTGQT